MVLTAETTCPGCNQSVESDSGGVVVAFGNGLWHIDCFKCAKCDKRVNADTNLLLLSDGNPVCMDCTYHCSACKQPILDEAIMTGDDSYHTRCFICRQCSGRIKELVFAKTSVGIYCMECHNERVARVKRYREKKAEALKGAQDGYSGVPPIPPFSGTAVNVASSSANPQSLPASTLDLSAGDIIETPAVQSSSIDNTSMDSNTSSRGNDGPSLNTTMQSTDHKSDMKGTDSEGFDNGEGTSETLYDTCSTLKQRMQHHRPRDLTGLADILDWRNPDHGGFALVYRGAYNEQIVAVKVLKHRKNLKNPAPWEASMERRLAREMNVWAALSHRNIVEFLGYTLNDNEFPAMISRWCEHGTAKAFLSHQNVTEETRGNLTRDVVDGLEYLHGLNVIHGDLKPTNILVDGDFTAKLCDFGLVRLDQWSGTAGMTTTSPYTGTERYKAAELFPSAANRYPVATMQGDIYALGCVMLEFIESCEPYGNLRYYDLEVAIKDETVYPAKRPPEAKGTGGFSQYFWDLLERCWSPYPELRPSAREMAEVLAHLFAMRASS